MNILEGNLISEFIQLGSSQRNAATTFQVYLELCEVKRLFDVNYYYSDVINRMYLTAKSTKSSSTSIFIPLLVSEKISFDLLEKMISIHSSNSIYLALLSPDSTCVYYELTSGLVDVATPNSMRTDRRELHDSVLNSKRSDIEEIRGKSSSSSGDS